MYKYVVSGYYFIQKKDSDEKRESYFSKMIIAPNNYEAMKIALGEIAWEHSLAGEYVFFDRFHYDCEDKED